MEQWAQAIESKDYLRAQVEEKARRMKNLPINIRIGRIKIGKGEGLGDDGDFLATALDSMAALAEEVPEAWPVLEVAMHAFSEAEPGSAERDILVRLFNRTISPKDSEDLSDALIALTDFLEEAGYVADDGDDHDDEGDEAEED